MSFSVEVLVSTCTCVNLCRKGTNRTLNGILVKYFEEILLDCLMVESLFARNVLIEPQT